MHIQLMIAMRCVREFFGMFWYSGIVVFDDKHSILDNSLALNLGVLNITKRDLMHGLIYQQVLN
jgi:hypothetical protein